jgi:hypothetical protein
MKEISFTLMLIIVFAITCSGQGLYSKQNLEKASKENLTLYLTKAENLKKAGGVMTIAGSSSTIVGVILMAIGESTAYVGFYMTFAGLGSTVIGIPILATGSSRVKKISKAWNTKYNAAMINLVPCGIYNYQTQNIKPGVSLRIKF